MAFGLIATEEARIERFVSRETLGNGLYQNTYAPAVGIEVSAQSVDQQMYADLGLDRNRHYMTFYCLDPVSAPERDTGGDRIVWNAMLWQVTNDLNWRAQDGWSGVVAVNIPFDDERKPLPPEDTLP